MILLDKAMQYAEDVVNGTEITTKEVKTQCKWFLEDLKKQNNKDFIYYFDKNSIQTTNDLISLMNFATGIGVVGKSILEGLWGFQAFFLCNIFGWRYKDNPKKFRYKDVTLFIPRKNSKTFIVAVILIILMLTEDDYSEFYSICLDRDLAGETKKAITQIINASPAIKKYFKISKSLNGKIECLITHSYYQARTAEGNRNNAIRPAAFVADEIGAFKDYNNIGAMKSGQLSVRNPLVFKTTTAYAEDKSIMLEELDYIKKVYNGLIKNNRMFALLYYADEKHLWDDVGLQMSNPLRIPENYEEIRNNRETALNKPAEREEYLTKHMNHFVPANSGESFIDIKDLRKCKIKNFDWKGRKVYLGLDLALTNDNCSVSMATYNQKDGCIYADSFAFIPKDRIEEKNKFEKINYYEFIKAKKCFACGDRTVSYLFIEDFIMQIEEKFGVEVVAIGYDRANCLSTAQKLEQAGYNCVQVRQHSDTLHAPTKLLEEYILNCKFHYTENRLLEINFQNARCTYDTTLRKYVNKKKSNGKVDMVVSLIIALYLLQLEELLNNNDFVVQVI